MYTPKSDFARGVVDLMLSATQKQALERIVALAERQLEQDRGHLSGPSISLNMLADVEADDAALEWAKRAFHLRTAIGRRANG